MNTHQYNALITFICLAGAGSSHYEWLAIFFIFFAVIFGSSVLADILVDITNKKD